MDSINPRQWLSLLRHSRFGVPLLLLSVLAMVMLPLSPLVLDILFTFNIVLSVMILLTCVNSQRPLDFAVFPTLLLVVTLMRLALNVASTRVVLLNGHEGPGAAGKVIESFGNVVIGGNFVVGFVVFIILMIANFVVVTKGAERISEVSARFTLDALPGKQMAIDADLNAGLINQQQARDRRKEVASEADFYGAMDGASKFVRGDAIAGIMILLINVTGGILIGVFSHHLPAGQAFEQYVLLTIGDGLVAQIPSLLLSTAAAIIVTRVTDGSDIGSEIRTQLLAQPNTLYTAALVMFVLAIVPGMPHWVFLGFSALLLFAAWHQRRQAGPTPQSHEQLLALKQTLEVEEEKHALSWQTLPITAPLGLNLGYQLVGLVNKESNSPLTQRIRGVRQVISEQMGILLPAIPVREDFKLNPTQYAVLLNGVALAVGEVYPDRLMAIGGSEQFGEVEGLVAHDPAWGMDVTWIAPDEKSHAIGLGFQVVDSASVIATHMHKLALAQLADLFNYDDITQLQERLSTLAPKLTEELNAQLSFSLQLKVLRLLLQELVPVKDIVTVATALVEGAPVTKDPLLLAADVRFALRRALYSTITSPGRPLSAYTLNGELENLLLSALNNAQQTGKVALDSFPVDPNILTQLQTTLPEINQQLKQQKLTQVLLVTPQLRPLLARYARQFAPGLAVLSYNEVPDDADLRLVGQLS